MKNIKLVKPFQLSFLLLAISLLILCSPLISNAQNSSTSINLENTEWGATASEHYAFYARSPVMVLYKFGTQGTVKVLVSFVYAPPPQRTFDPSSGQWKTTYYSPEIKSVEDPNGKYKLTGNSIRIEFSDHVINATINANRMSGEVIDKSNGKETNWGAERVSSGSSNQSVPNNSTALTIANCNWV